VTEPEQRPPASTPPDPEPDYLRRARFRRKAWDLYFPMVVGVVWLSLLIAVAVVPPLRDPSVIGVLGAGLAGLAGFGLRKGS
jgi:hypothetical protein